MNSSINVELTLKHLPYGALALNKEGVIQYANPAALSITGFRHDELINQPVTTLYLDAGDAIRTEYELQQAAKTGSFIAEGWKLKKEGKKYWGVLTYAPIFSGNELLGYSCTLMDTSVQKQHEWALRKNEGKYRLMVEAVKDYAIFMLDPNGYILTWNEGARYTKGYSAAEIIGKHFSTFYTAEDLEDKKPERELKIAIQTGKYEEEGWRVKKKGSVFWANVIITALFDEENKLLGFSKVTRDLSSRKQNEEALKQSEERYRSLVQQVTDYGIFMLDEKGRIISWNEGAKKIKGYTSDEVIGKYFSIFYPEEDIILGKPAQELKQAIAVGKYEEEGWRLRKDGSRFWANVVITAVYDSKKVLIGFSKVTRDLTEKKEAERALTESYRQYRNLFNELKVTNEELLYANQELEQFTSIVSHDLQEPVRSIKSFLQLIAYEIGDEGSENLKTYISKAIGSANRMKELIQNLLHYSQLSKGDLEVQKVNVQELLSQVLQNLKPTIDASGATVAIENNLDTVEGDPVQLSQLVQNLLTNALKFINNDKPNIKIRSYLEDGHVKFAVSDNGIGIANGDVDKIFEIFRRLNTSKAYPGTGIGLAICKKIVDRHNGRIWPESTPGKGTTFYFTLNEENALTQPA